MELATLANLRRCAALLIVAFSGRLVHAQPQQPRVVLLTPLDPSAALSETFTAIVAQISDLPVHIVVERHEPGADLHAQIEIAAHIASAEHARGVFWLSLDAPGDALLYFLDGQGSHLLVRRIHHDTADTDTAAVTEEIANVTRANVAALAEGREIGMLPFPLPGPPPQLGSKAARTVQARSDLKRIERPWSIGVDLAWVGSDWASSVPFESGFGLGGELTHRSGFAVRATFTFFPTSNVGAEGSSIHLTRHPTEVTAIWDAHIHRLEVGVELGAIVDPVTRQTSQVADGFQATPTDTTVTFALSPKARLGVRLWPWLRVFGRFGVDVYIAQNDYEVAGQAPLLLPRRARGRFDIGIDVIAW